MILGIIELIDKDQNFNYGKIKETENRIIIKKNNYEYIDLNTELKTMVTETEKELIIDTKNILETNKLFNLYIEFVNEIGERYSVSINIDYNIQPINLNSETNIFGEDVVYFGIKDNKVIIRTKILTEENIKYKLKLSDKSNNQSVSPNILSYILRPEISNGIDIEAENNDSSAILKDEFLEEKNSINIDAVSYKDKNIGSGNISAIYIDPLLDYSNYYCSVCFIEYRYWDDITKDEKNALLSLARRQLNEKTKMERYKKRDFFKYLVVEQAYHILKMAKKKDVSPKTITLKMAQKESNINSNVDLIKIFNYHK